MLAGACARLESAESCRERFRQARTVAQSIGFPKLHVHESASNRFEYAGIHLVWRLACLRNNGVFLYFHSKGIGLRSDGNTRWWQEEALMGSVVAPWRKVLHIFETNPNVNTIGLLSADGSCTNPGDTCCRKPRGGYQWFNFWWARGVYLSRLVEPMITTHRHYYEEWLGMVKQGGGDCPRQSLPSNLLTNEHGRTCICHDDCFQGANSSRGIVNCVQVTSARSGYSMATGRPVGGCAPQAIKAINVSARNLDVLRKFRKESCQGIN